MYRRVVSLILVPCVLLTPSAVLAHGHGGDAPAGHDLRPHRHAKPVFVERFHGHHHHGRGGHHHHDDAEIATAPPTPSTPPPRPPSDHDSDATFVAGIDAVVGARTGDVPSVSLLSGVTANPSQAVVFAAISVRHSVCRAHPPPPGRDCPLYVRHLALLI